ncbi:hypothetical protein BJY24_004324 [Nocardia transvalensis]|uniref:Uncharacterized protein n=1 Tax=Nocardia transvalensis TaxID=37333 RepID=A0A7W9PFX5_9NOCA|nr:hypothetical protein [Nocardia transvalensis]
MSVTILTALGADATQVRGPGAERVFSTVHHGPPSRSRHTRPSGIREGTMIDATNPVTKEAGT